MKWHSAWDLLRQTYSEWKEDRAARLAAALAYYAVFSLTPLLIIVIAVAGLVFGWDAARGKIVEQLQGLLGSEGAKQIETMIRSASEPKSGFAAGAIGIGALVLGASGLFAQLQDGLDTIWEVKPRSDRGILAVLKSRFLSFTMVLGIGFLLLVSLVISAGLSALGGWLDAALPGLEALTRGIEILVGFVVTAALFAAIYKILPDVEIGWKDVRIGAIATALLFLIGKYAIGLYLGHANVGSAFGAAGSLIVILVWVYYSAQILFFGAEFTQVYAGQYGTRIKPTPEAEPVTEEARAEQGSPREEEHEREPVGHR